MHDFETYQQRIDVRFDYPVHFTRDLFSLGNPLLADVLDRRQESRRHKCLVFLDSGVASAWPDLAEAIKEYFHAHPTGMELCGLESVPGGEAAKTSWARVREVMWTAGNLHMDRQSFIMAIGGGSVIDMVGFAASIVHRGLRLIRVPTTTLAQNDAGVGVKNGMDEHGMKNFVGTFAPPFAVLNDFSFLATLPQDHWIGGVSEAFKVAIIKDAGLFGLLRSRADDLRLRRPDAMEEVVYRTALLHLEHIRTGGDPFEFGSARPLDFGHWSAHKLEAMTGFAIGHGQAVSIGIALDSCYAMRQGLITADEFEQITGAMVRCGLPIWHEQLDSVTHDGLSVVLQGLDEFREHLGGVLTVTLPDGIGRRVEVHQMNTDCLQEAITMLKTIHGSRGK